MRINEVDRPVTQDELDQLEAFADRLFGKVGIDVEFTRHFIDRVNDERNVKQITASELTRLFKQEFKKWGKKIAQLGPDAEAVMKDMATDINMPFALRWDSRNQELDLIAKTIMRKKNFRTPNQEYIVEGWLWDVLTTAIAKNSDDAVKNIDDLPTLSPDAPQPPKVDEPDIDAPTTTRRTDDPDIDDAPSTTRRTDDPDGAPSGTVDRNRGGATVDVGSDSGSGYSNELWNWLMQYGPLAQLRLSESVRLLEGGAMPGVGAIHIEEINPTLEQLEKALDLDLKDFVLGSVGKREFSGDIDVALNIKPEDIPEFVEKLKKSPLIHDIAKSSVIMTKVQIVNYDESKSDGRPRTGYVQLDFMPGDPGWLKTYFHSPSDKESKYKGVFRNLMIAAIAAVHNRQDSDAKLEDGRSMESLRYMWSPTEGLIRVKRTPVPKKSGEGYTKKNKNERVDGPWKTADAIAQELGLDSGAQLNSFETLLDAVKKNYTKEMQRAVIKGFVENPTVQDVGVPEELKNEN